MAIPIQNIYYLLTYAWNQLEIGREAAVGTENYRHNADFFAKVLLNVLQPVLRTGLHRTYELRQENLPLVRGRLEVAQTLRRHSRIRGSAVCSFDEFTADNIYNRIIKASVYRLLRQRNIDVSLGTELRASLNRLSGVKLLDDIPPSYFTGIRFDRNNRRYRFILHICKLILDTVSLKEDGDDRFNDFIRSEQMGRFFEAFIRNFYRLEADGVSVSSPRIQWHDTHKIAGGSEDLLPGMQTDVVLNRFDRYLLIEVKFYRRSLLENYGKRLFRSGHLYQLNTYLHNYSPVLPEGSNLEGLLLYAQAGQGFDETYLMGKFKVRMVSLNLAQDWTGIHEDLIRLF